VLDDTDARSSIILEGYTSAPFIKKDERNTTTGVKWIVNLLHL
jgi:hypothetical protein